MVGEIAGAYNASGCIFGITMHFRKHTPVSRKNSFMKQQKSLISFNLSLWLHVLCDNNEACRCTLKYGGCLEETHLCDYFSCKLN